MTLWPQPQPLQPIAQVRALSTARDTTTAGPDSTHHHRPGLDPGLHALCLAAELPCLGSLVSPTPGLVCHKILLTKARSDVGDLSHVLIRGYCYKCFLQWSIRQSGTSGKYRRPPLSEAARSGQGEGIWRMPPATVWSLVVLVAS